MGNVHLLPLKSIELPEFEAQNVKSNTFSLASIDSVPHVSNTTSSRRPLHSANANHNEPATHKPPATPHGNGVTGVHVSSEMVATLSTFWWTNIERGVDEGCKAEISVLIFFHMWDALKHDKNFKHLYKRTSIRHVASKLLHMTHWLILALNEPNLDLQVELKRLGQLHRRYAIKLKYFQIYLAALHAVLEEYFAAEYTIEIKFSLDHIFTHCVQLMFGRKLDIQNHGQLQYYHEYRYQSQRRHSRSHHLTVNTHPMGNARRSSSFGGIARLMDWNESRSLKQSTQWLANLNACLQSQIGREYFFRYLQQTSCREIEMFLRLYQRFKRSVSEKEKFMILRKIDKWCVGSNQHTAMFAINISYETKQTFMRDLQMLETSFKAQSKSPRSISFSPTSPATLGVSEDDGVEIILAMDDQSGQSAQQSMQTLSSWTLASFSSQEFRVNDDILDAMLFETKRLIFANHWKPFCAQIQSMNINDLEY